CLSGSTPVVIKTSRGISRTKLETLYRIFMNGNEEVYVPGIHGDWRLVTGVLREPNREVMRITLCDGSCILATPNHRFPTADGLLAVSDLQPGNVLLRSSIAIPESGTVDTEIGWVAGLFLAEGSFKYQSRAVRFTLH